MRVGHRLLVVISALLVTLLLLPSVALAHAHLIRTDLTPNGRLLVQAGVYRFWFDEALTPSLSQVVIRDAQGNQVNSVTGTLNPSDSTELDIKLPTLSNGQYTVIWTSDSAQDGHIMHGFYVFTVGGPGATAPVATATAIAAPTSASLDITSLVLALAHWLVLVASAVWTGAVALELLVLRRPLSGAIVAFAASSSARVVGLLRLGLLATVLTNLAELEGQAYAASGWGGLVSYATLSDISHSHYGTFWLVRVLLTFLALLVLGSPSSARASAPTNPAGGTKEHGHRGSAQVVQPTQPRVASRGALVAGSLLALTVLGLGYLLALALSGHAAAVSRLVATSVLLDWLHLLAMSVWVGCILAIALLLVPALTRATERGSEDRSLARVAFLDLLDRFSPAAYLAVITAGATGMFNAQVHLNSVEALMDSAYGRFLLIKLALIAEMMLLSGSHVFLSRPRLRRMAVAADEGRSLAGFASLCLRLRVEAILGVLILLCVALMGQVAPAVTVFSAASDSTVLSTIQSVNTPIIAPPQAISGQGANGSLLVGLIIDPPVVGQARFLVTVQDRKKPVTDAQVRIKLSMPANAGIGAAFVETTPTSGVYNGSGDLVQNGQWRAEVLVRTHDDPLEFRSVPLDFLVGPNASFIVQTPVDTRFGSAAVRLTQPSNAPDTLFVQLRSGLTVRYQISMPSMPGMGTGIYPAVLGNDGWYSGQVLFPMAGLTHVLIQVQQAGVWHTVRSLTYEVSPQGVARLLATSAAVPSPTLTASVAKNVTFALRLPYRALITHMRNDTVTHLDGTSVHTGRMPHGVDLVDGTNLAYVTDFLAGDVVILDSKTLQILHRIAVGLEPAHVVFSADHRRAFVTNFLTNDVSVIDMRTAKVVGDVQVDLRPHGLDLSPDGTRLYVGCAGGGAVDVIDTKTLKVVSRAPAGLEPIGVAVNTVNGDIYVSDALGNAVRVLEPGSLAQRARIAVGKGPALLTVSADGRRLYVANQLGNSVSVIDTSRFRVVATIAVGSGPHGLDLTPDGKYLYVASINAGTVTIIRMADNQVSAVVVVGQGPNEVAILH